MQYLVYMPDLRVIEKRAHKRPGETCCIIENVLLIEVLIWVFYPLTTN